MSLVNAYCTVNHVRTHLGDDANMQPLELLERAVNAASRAVDKHCRRKFWLDAAVTTRVYRTASTARAVVHDIGSLTGLVIKTDSALDGTWATTWTATDYQLGPLNVDVVAASDTGDPFSFWSIDAIGDYQFETATDRRATLQVTARHGWSDIPDEVTQATILKAAALFKRKDAPFGVAGFGEYGAVRITRQDIDVLELLDGFRRFRALVA